MDKYVLLKLENVITTNALRYNNNTNNLLLALKHVKYLLNSHFKYMTLGALSWQALG